MGVGFNRLSTGSKTVVERIIEIVRPEMPKLPNPNPLHFSIVKSKKCGDVYVTMVHYPDCTNFEGNKILVTLSDLSRKRKVDPHFMKSSDLLARFVPTEEGWLMAIGFAQSIAK
jgi:hypothetical protein